MPHQFVPHQCISRSSKQELEGHALECLLGFDRSHRIVASGPGSALVAVPRSAVNATSRFVNPSTNNGRTSALGIPRSIAGLRKRWRWTCSDCSTSTACSTSRISPTSQIDHLGIRRTDSPSPWRPTLDVHCTSRPHRVDRSTTCRPDGQRGRHLQPLRIRPGHLQRGHHPRSIAGFPSTVDGSAWTERPSSRQR